MSRAPIFVDTFDLCEWVLHHFSQREHPLSTRICSTSLDLLEAITLALKDRDRDLQLDRADQVLICLRAHVRLAESAGLLEERQGTYVFEHLDSIGRQLGGWLRSLGPA